MKLKTALYVLQGVFVLLIPFDTFAGKVGGGDLIFTPKNAASVLFSHEKHVNGDVIKCTACHYQIFQMEHGADKMQMTKITDGDFCGRCHNGNRAFDVKEQQNCSRCHHS